MEVCIEDISKRYELEEPEMLETNLIYFFQCLDTPIIKTINVVKLITTKAVPTSIFISFVVNKFISPFYK